MQQGLPATRARPSGRSPPTPLLHPVCHPPPPTQGPLCFTVSATYDTSKVKTTPSYTDAFEALAPTTTFSRKVRRPIC